MNRKYIVPLLLAAAAAVAVMVWWQAPRDTVAERQVPAPLPLTTSRDDLARTVEIARARLSADPTDATAGTALADALLRQARVESDGALAIEAERVLRGVLREAPSHYEANRLLGAVYLGQHRFADALEAAAKARNLRPQDAYNYGVLGDAYLELGRYEEAFDAFDQMARLRPSAAAYARVAYAHELQGRLREAVRHMRMSAEATGPNDPEGLAWFYAQLGNLHYQLGEIDAAAREYARADHAFPRHPYARLGLARIAVARGNYGAALEEYRAMLDEAPTPELAATVGDLLAVTGDAAAAQVMYARAEALEREGWENEAPQPAALARLLAERNLKVDEAVRLAEAAAAERSDIYTLDALAWAYYRAGRLEDARNASIKARRTGTVDPRVLYHAAAIEHALGNDDEARGLLARAAGYRAADVLVEREASALAAQLGRGLRQANRDLSAGSSAR